MIKSIQFVNFRNLSNKYEFNEKFNVISGVNNGGKTNLLEGIRLAFSAMDGSYFKVSKSDFLNSDDSKPIEIFVELEYNSIPSLNYKDANDVEWCGFRARIRKTKSGHYIKELAHYNGNPINRDIILDDSESIPNVHPVPLYRVEDLYAPGLSVGLASFLESDDAYGEIKEKSKNAIKDEISKKEERFKKLTAEFTNNLSIDVASPSISSERLFIVDGDKEHNAKIGAGYRSIANMFLCTLDGKYNILLIDEIENHIHPSLLRSLIRKLIGVDNLFVVATTHSPVVLNETKIESLIEVTVGSLASLDSVSIGKLNMFLHPGRGELIVSENIVLVEGYTEELLLKDYIVRNNKNWTVVNVAGVMFEPYIKLAHLLKKKTIVVSDDDRFTTENCTPSSRFENLKALCGSLEITLLQAYNTLETDLFNNRFLEGFDDLLEKKSEEKNFTVAKKNKKSEIALRVIENEVDLSNWHVITSIEDEFKSN
ncbi:MAG: AAA family ATPase [Bacteroidota bacterium]|nr:AAA family ATPase [Bacteroidota bacterium]